MNGQVKFWDCDPDAEILNFSEIDEAVASHLDLTDRQDGKIIVYGFAPMVVPVPTEGDAYDLLADFFERNWEDFQGDDSPDFTNSMEAAARVFLATVHRDFESWNCEQITSQLIDVAEWLAENRPDLLKERTP